MYFLFVFLAIDFGELFKNSPVIISTEALRIELKTFIEGKKGENLRIFQKYFFE